MNAPVLVTGGNGFVGSHVVEALLNAGYKVRCLLRPASKLNWLESLPIDVHRADYRDAAALKEPLAGCRAILHFGGATKAADENAYLQANAESVRSLLQAATETCPDLRLFLYCSSQAALGPAPTAEPLSEESPPHPITAYGRSKLAGEEVCRNFAAKFPIAMVRPPAVYGPRDRDVFIFFKLIKYGISPTIGSDERLFSLVHVLDIAQLYRLILERPPTELRLYHVTDGVVHRWSEVSAAIAAALGRKPLKLKIPSGAALTISRFAEQWATLFGRSATLNREKMDDLLQPYWLISSQRAARELGYQPEYDLERGVKMTAEWYREVGWL